MPITAPYGTWTSPLSARSVAAGGVQLSRVVLDGDDLYWLERRPEEGGRSVVVRREPGRSDRGRHARRNQRANPRPRVRRGSVRRVAGDHLLLRVRGPAGVPARAGRRPRAAHAGWSVVLRRLRRRPCAPATGLRARGPHASTDREAVTTLVSLALDGPPAGRDGDRLGSRFLFEPTLQSRRLAPGVAGVAPSRHAVGQHRAVGRGRRPGRSARASDTAWPAAAMSRSTSQGGRRTARCTSCRIAPDGGISTVCAPGRWRPFTRWRRSSVRPNGQFGTSTWAFADESRLVSAYLEDGTWRLASIDVASGALVPIDVDVEPGDNIVATATHAVFIGSSSRAPDAVVRVTLATGAVETIRVASTLTIDPGYLSNSRGARVSDRGWPDGARVLLPAVQS